MFGLRRKLVLTTKELTPRIENSYLVNPVMFPLGRAKLFTKPAPTGSATCANTIGMVLVAFSKAAKDAVAEATSSLYPDSTSYTASTRIPSALPFASCASIPYVRPSVQQALKPLANCGDPILCFLTAFELREQ